ncbi:MAG: hypothetical protein P1V35_11065 [Planctomycetota bacterium]|nr:hypothetical protein [Planctomycetota bacterium]
MENLSSKAVRSDGSTQNLSGSNARTLPFDSTPTEVATNYWFAALEAAEIRFALLRGQDLKSRERAGSDLDLIVHPDDLTGLKDCLEAACEHSGVHIVQEFRTPHSVQIQLHGRTDEGIHSLLTLDIHTAETCYGVAYLSAERLLTVSGQAPAERFQIPGNQNPPMVPTVRPGWAGLVRFLGAFLSGGVVDAGRLSFLKEAGPRERAAIRLELGLWFGSSLGERIDSALMCEDEVGLRSMAHRARRTLLRRKYRYAPLTSLRETVGTAFALRLRPLFQPRGLCAAFIGTDGSGKTTLIEAVNQFLEPHYRDGQNKVHKLRPGFLPQINRLVNWKESSYTAEDCKEPHRAKPSGLVGSALRATWYAADCVLGWPLRVLPLRRRNSLQIFDRYYHDFLVDPERARINRSSRVTQWAAKYIPRPERILVCVADPEWITERKLELPPHEVHRQANAYFDLAENDDSLDLIRTDCDLSESLDQALTALFQPRVSA